MHTHSSMNLSSQHAFKICFSVIWVLVAPITWYGYNAHFLPCILFFALGTDYFAFSPAISLNLCCPVENLASELKCCFSLDLTLGICFTWSRRLQPEVRWHFLILIIVVLLTWRLFVLWRIPVWKLSGSFAQLIFNFYFTFNWFTPLLFL